VPTEVLKAKHTSSVNFPSTHDGRRPPNLITMQQAHSCQNPLMQKTPTRREKNCMKAAGAPYSFLALKTYGAFTLDVKSMFNENLGGILGGTQC
jgi:hypothetical protein